MRRILAVMALLAIVLVGCGDDSNDAPGGEDAADTTDGQCETVTVMSASGPAVASPESAAFERLMRNARRALQLAPGK